MLTILLAAAGVLAAFLAAAIPPLAAQASALAGHLPHYMHTLQDHNSQLGRLNDRFHIEQRLSRLLSTKGSALIGGVLGAGELVLSTASSLLVVAVLVVYFLIGMPRIRLFAYRLAPRSRRTRVILIGDEIFTKVGGYVLGNFLTSAIAGLGTYFWMLAFGVPYPWCSALMVALLDLIPVIGSTVGGAIVTLVALTVSLPVALATLAFYVAYRLAEDYLLVPQDHGQDRAGARGGVRGRGAGGRHADGHHRGSGGDPGRGRAPAPAGRGGLPPPGHQLSRRIVQADQGRRPRRGWRAWLRTNRRPLRRLVILLVLALIVEYLVIPELVGASKDLYLLGRVNAFWMIAGVILEAASLFCYALLTRALLPPEGRPSLSRLTRIDLSAAAVAHVIPAGTVGSAGIGYQLFTADGIPGTAVGVMMATKGMGSTVVLNVLLWISLVISIPLSGFRPVYATVAIVGAILLAAMAALILGITRGGKRAARIVRAIGGRIPGVGGDRLEKIVLQASESVRALGRDRRGADQLADLGLAELAARRGVAVVLHRGVRPVREPGGAVRRVRDRERARRDPVHARRARGHRHAHAGAAGRLRADPERRDPRRARLAAGELLAADPHRRRRLHLPQGAKGRRLADHAPGALRPGPGPPVTGRCRNGGRIRSNGKGRNSRKGQRGGMTRERRERAKTPEQRKTPPPRRPPHRAVPPEPPSVSPCIAGCIARRRYSSSGRSRLV